MYQGDTSICAINTKGYNISRSQSTPDGCEKYSIQVEALFIINRILFDDPYAYSSFPVLKKNDSSAAESIDGNLIKEAYKSYHDWLEYAKKNGFNNTLKDAIYPLKSSNPVRWY